MMNHHVAFASCTCADTLGGNGCGVATASSFFLVCVSVCVCVCVCFSTLLFDRIHSRK